MVDIAQAAGVPLTVVDLSDADLRERYGSDAALVRPDQYVAWSAPAATMGPLAVGAILDRVRGVPQQDPLGTGPAIHPALS